MAVQQDIRAFVDEYLATSKTLEGEADWGIREAVRGEYMWRKEILYGTGLEGRLEATVQPNTDPLKFKIHIVLRESSIWRIDYGTCCHTNVGELPYGVPRSVFGPHYHPWPLNRHLAKANRLPEKLAVAIALPHEKLGDFYTAFRWFCDQTNLIVPSPDVPLLPNKRLL